MKVKAIMVRWYKNSFISLGFEISVGRRSCAFLFGSGAKKI